MEQGFMTEKQLAYIGQTQQERLFHIDFKLRFLGTINRSDLMSRFGIKPAAATRDLTQYRDIVPGNLRYDTKAKTYVTQEGFRPLFPHSENQVLTALCHGLGDDFVGKQEPLINAESLTPLSFPDLDALSVVTRAIHRKKVLSIQYYSLSSGKSVREIVPFALVDNGLRWHVRAYDRKSETFRDFVVNRIAEPQMLDENAPEGQTRDDDVQWNRLVEINIVPHPDLQYPEAIAREYTMVDGALKTEVRAAIVGYVLRHWNVDCSENHKLDSSEFHLWLSNPQVLNGIESAQLAPGYSGK